MAHTSALSSDRTCRWQGAAAHGSSRGRGALARRRAELEARWRKTLERVTALSVAYHEAAAGQPGSHDPRGSQAAEPGLASRDVSRIARRVAAERQMLAEIEAALDRIAAGRYGRCEQCRRPIPAGLLAGRPEARFCPVCSNLAAIRPAGG